MSQHKAKGIRTLPNGRHIAYVQVGVHQRFKRFPPGTALSTVRNWLDTMRVALRADQARIPSGTLEADTVTFLRFLADRPLLQKERARQMLWWNARFGHRNRGNITPQEIQAELVALRASGRSASTCNRYRQALLSLYDHLNVTGATNPVGHTMRFEPPQAPPRAVSYDVIRLILDALSDYGFGRHRLDGSKAKARLLVLAYTGMRPCELKRLEPSDWDRSAHALVIRTGKGGRFRTIPLTMDAEGALAELLRVGALGRYSASNVRRALLLACDKVGLKARIRTYDMRHSWGTAMYQAAGDLRIVADMMGHSSTATTARYTLGHVPAFMQTATERFAELAGMTMPPPDDTIVPSSRQQRTTPVPLRLLR